MTSRFTKFSISVRKVFLVARRIVANENYCLFFPDKDREKYAILDCDGEKKLGYSRELLNSIRELSIFAEIKELILGTITSWNI